ncbi:hypothetical protein G7B40_003490 [Aetokthonos hydrillicola Thurmond2011]|jgi:hypothetical protein|uniref:Uncharacterized protein n=1 Tax=Aetokthonos hydrillicola Thurmond2011 TaxID=2712845 RepID=A0AAP5M3C9_9CYAN|nr:hypothetical protein [Aetokthonos hydrillicola]MBO3462298.1 hypothetical protein [Aetokthonos hydrillicola CCALA 1050]MBW4590809.1 hypothetical protein [Aetokthonos hydrillicola CCALA 1050]MDR9893646.1 hypothetical protein [Aetokthonos hydrillicola Thurmond2011]
MDDFAIIFSTNEKYLSQALFMYEQLREHGLEKYAWVVPLETLKTEHLECLHTHFNYRVTDVLQMPKNVKLTSNKIFLPKMVPRVKHYILIDTDILILDRRFIDTFLNCADERIVLVGETFLWKEWLSFLGLSAPIEQFPHLLERPYLLETPYVQTGSIGISSQIHESIFDTFVEELTAEYICYGNVTIWGDSIIWNDWVSRFPHLFQLVIPQSCLVLRPDSSGASSKLHIPDLTYKNGILLYHNVPVMALHFTESNGIVRKWNDYQSLLEKLSL